MIGIQEIDGRLSLNQLPTATSWMTFDFRVRLFGLREPMVIDHVALTLPSEHDLCNYVDALDRAGARVTERPAVWPDAFCPGRPFPADLRMHFAAALMASGGTVVVAAPCRPLDQLDRFRRERGALAIHHVAALVDSPCDALTEWAARGFRPRSPLLDDGDLAQQFLANDCGQLVELIKRRNGSGNFSCTNLSALRAAED